MGCIGTDSSAENRYNCNIEMSKGVSTPIKIKSASFVASDFKSNLNWNDIIGLYRLDDQYIDLANIRVTTNPISSKFSHFPRTIKAKILRRPPVGGGTVDNQTASKIFDLVYRRDLSTRTEFIYTNEPSKTDDTVTLSNIPSIPPSYNKYTVATIVRAEGTSDSYFREAIGPDNFVNRGIAIEDRSRDKDKDIGDKKSERPPPYELFLAGGVEVVELIISPQSGIETEGNQPVTDKILVKSPASIFYYSVHGYSNLHEPQGVLISVSPYISPEDLHKAWSKNHIMVNTLIIAGCSVCSIHKIKGHAEFDGKNRDGVGMRWAKLLYIKEGSGGPVKQICGYWGSAPLDKNGGNDIASRMGHKITKSSEYAKEWIQIHYDKYIDESWPDVTTTAASLTDNSFFYIEYSGINRITEEKIYP